MPLPPLVEPGPELTPDEIARFSRHLLLPEVGVLGQRRLRNARVLVVGAGGLGSPVLLYLAAAGIGTIGLVDDDVVEESNLQRQVVHGRADLGRAKVDSAADAVAAISPDTTVVRHRVRLTADTAEDVVRGYHLVIDGTDTFATRYLVNDVCALVGVPYVWGSIFRFDGQVSVFWADPPAAPDGTAVPGVTYRDLFPEPPPPGLVPSCAEGGVLGVVPAVVGSVMATEALKLVCGVGEPLLGRLMIYDALAMTWRTVRVRPAPDTPRITGLRDEASCRVPDAAALPTVTPRELAALLDGGDVVLVDVREAAEREIVGIPGAVLVPVGRFRSGEALAEIEALTGGPQGRRLVLHCKSGGRSAEALRVLRAAGYGRAAHLEGGVLAWIDEVEPARPRY